MLDVISRGRIEMGFVKGVPFEISPANTNPAELTERFWEAHDLILKAMTSHDGPFNWGARISTTARSMSGRALGNSRIPRYGCRSAAPAARWRRRRTV